MSQDIGLIGLAVMGQNLALNMAEKGWGVSVYNRTASKVVDFIEGPAKNSNILGFSNISAFFASLRRPRKVIFMVKAGTAVDELIAQALPYLEEGDVLIDGGNSFFQDSERRMESLRARGILFLGAGISGGEEGARHGPSIMPGGSPDAWPLVKDIFQSVSAKVDGTPCCEWIGRGGAGHFVKMVHNGIEYADMQLIAESYDLLHRGYGCTSQELSLIFSRWNRGKLNSYLIEITAMILGKKDADGQPIVEKILDVAGQKGTGIWTVMSALETQTPLTVVCEAVFARYISASYDDRVLASQALGDQVSTIPVVKELFVDDLEKALYAAKIICYAQGFWLIRQASQQHGWTLNLGNCALLWRGGCIIRSAFLGKINEAFTRNPDLSLLITDPFFRTEMHDAVGALRRVVASGMLAGVPLPCFAAALSWYDSVRSKRLPTNVIQAQRDCFGAHMFERLDKPRGEMFHVEWSEK